jgi:hypothetical protein
MSYCDDEYDEDPYIRGPPDYSKQIRQKLMCRIYKEIFYEKSPLNELINKIGTLTLEFNGHEKDSLMNILKITEFMMTQLNNARRYEIMAKYEYVSMLALKSETKESVNKFLSSHLILGKLINRIKTSSEDIFLHKELDKVIVLLKKMKIIEIKNALNNTFDSDEDDVSDFDEI